MIARPTEILAPAEAAVVTAGPALYLIGHVLFRLRMTGSVAWLRLAGAIACVLVGLAGTLVPGLLLSALLLAVVVAVIAGETAIRAGAAQPRPA